MTDSFLDVVTLQLVIKIRTITCRQEMEYRKLMKKQIMKEQEKLKKDQLDRQKSWM